MFLSNLEEHHVVIGTRLCITFRQTTLNSRYAGKKANKTNKNKRARHSKQTKTTKKAPRTPKTNHLRKINCTSFVNYFYSPCSTEPLYLEPSQFSPLCAARTYHGVHEEICPSPRFSLYEVWRRSRRFHLERVWQPDNFWGFDVIHISCSKEKKCT